MSNTNNIAKSVVSKGRSNFKAIGTVQLNDFSFKRDIISDRSGFQYSSCNFGINVGTHSVFVESMGGFFPNNKDSNGNHRDNLLYVNDSADFMNRFTLDFADRFDEDLTESVHNMNFVNVGVKVGEDGKVIREKFLSEYDMIGYLEDNLCSGDVIFCSGEIEHSIYNDEVQARKQIKNIYITKAEPEDFDATFTQTILLNKDSIDKPKDGEIEIFAQVPEYISKIDGKPIKNTLVLPQQYVMEDTEVSKKLISKYMRAKKGKITEITIDGRFESSIQTGTVSEDELSPDMLELIDLGLFDKEEALEQQNKVIKGDRGREVLKIIRPHLRKSKDEGNVIISYVLDKYDDDELLTQYHYMGDDLEDTSQPKQEEATDENSEEVDLDDNSWLNEL